MSRPILVWIAVFFIGLGNLYLGHVFALIGVSARLKSRRSRLMGLIFAPLWLGGLGSLFLINGLQLTFFQACLLSVLFYVGYSNTRRYYGFCPEVPWPVQLNKDIDAVMRICARHGWDVSNPGSVAWLSTSEALHFDGGDYDILQRMRTDDELKWDRKLPDMAPKLNDGTIDYDRACAREIVSMARVFGGHEENPGMVNRFSEDHDFSQLHWDSYKSLLELGKAVQDQWGFDALWSTRRVSNLPSAE